MTTQLQPTLRYALVSRSTLAINTALAVGGTLFIALMAQISFPLPGSPVPFTGQTLAVLLLGTAYGANLGLATISLYIAAGVVGLPVFTQSTHGLSHLTGATGGYLVGMAAASYISGALAQKKLDQRFSTVIPTMLVSNVVIFAFGVLWLQHVTAQSWSWTFAHGFTPFIAAEALKIAIASTSLPVVWRLVTRLK
ncbi:MAG: biotin transporter BioY [Actinomycetes bacterium]